MINLVFSGDCVGCLAADLELNCLALFSDNKGLDKEWTVSCKYMPACRRMKDRLERAEGGADDDDR